MGKFVIHCSHQVSVAKVEEQVETVENEDEAVKAAEDPNSVEISDNIVLRKLLVSQKFA